MSGKDDVEDFPPPPTHLHADPDHWVDWSAPVWRVQENQRGRAGWNELRHYGPVAGNRFDPQQDPTAQRQPEGIQYVGASALVALSERYQATQLIPVHDPAAMLVGWTPIRPMQLLDFRFDFGTVNGASAAFNSADKRVTRQWARAAHLRWPEMDGIVYPAKKAGFPSIALFTHAATDPVWPDDPSYSRSLADPAARPLIDGIATKLRWGLDFGA